MVEESGRPVGFAERLEERGDGAFDVIHLSGHANLEADGRPFFLTEDDTGLPLRAYPDSFVKCLGGRWPRVLFLSGCRTAEAGSLAEALVVPLPLRPGTQ